MHPNAINGRHVSNKNFVDATFQKQFELILLIGEINMLLKIESYIFSRKA